MSVRVSDMDRGFKEALRQAKALNVKPYVKIGIQGNEATERKTVSVGEGSLASSLSLSVVDIGTFHEYGGAGGRPPRRSFLRDTIDERKRQYFAIVRLMKLEIASGKMDVLKALNILGEKIKSDVVQKISDGIPPDLAPETIARKNAVVGGGNASTPLIDTGQLRQSITYEVARRGST